MQIEKHWFSPLFLFLLPKIKKSFQFSFLGTGPLLSTKSGPGDAVSKFLTELNKLPNLSHCQIMCMKQQYRKKDGNKPEKQNCNHSQELTKWHLYALQVKFPHRKCIVIHCFCFWWNQTENMQVIIASIWYVCFLSVESTPCTTYFSKLHDE